MGWGCKFLYMKLEYVLVRVEEGSEKVDVMCD